MPRYIVSWPTRGVQVVTVEAKTAAEAERIAKTDGTEPWHEIVSSGRPRARREDAADVKPDPKRPLWDGI